MASLSLTTNTTTGTYVELSNQLNYVFKKNAAGVTKTDDVNIINGSILPGNELVQTTSPVYADKIWAESDILHSGPTIACLTTSSLGEPTKVAVSCYNPDTLEFTKLASVWGTGAFPGTSSGNSKLTGITWTTGLTNWIPPYFGAKYKLIFYAVPQRQSFTSKEYNDGKPDPSVAQGISNLTTPFVFDYTTGILTFTGAVAGGDYGGTAANPAIKVGGSSWNLCSTSSPNVTAYDIYMTQGYRYTGSNLSAATSVDVDIDMIKNIGRRAWVEGVTGTISFDPLTSKATHNLVFIGNASHYTITFGYKSITSPDIDTDDVTYEWSGPVPPAPYSSTYPMDGIFNNNWDIANGFPHDRATFGTHLIRNPTNTTINVPVLVNTNVAGGTGTRVTSYGGMYGGSKYALSIPLTMSETDLMGLPFINEYFYAFTIEGTTIAVDGFTYYTTGATVTIPREGLVFGNIYNVISPPGLDDGNLNTFNYATFTSGTSLLNLDKSDLRSLNNSTKPGSPQFLLTPPLTPGGDLYVNNSPIQLNVNRTTIGVTLKNLLMKTSGTTYSTLFPTTRSWGGNDWGNSQIYIGYLPNHPELGEVNLTVGPNIATSILPASAPVATRLSITRMSTINGLNLPLITGTPQWTTIDPIVYGYITPEFDAIYNPFGNPASAPLSGTLNASDFFTDLATTYIVPEKIDQPNPETVFPVDGTKHLLFVMDNSGPLITFPITFGTSSVRMGIKNISIYWYIPAVNAPGQRWWTAVENNINVDHGTSGAGGGWDWKTVTIAMNDVMQEQYVNFYNNNNPSNTSIFVCVEFSGTLNISEIVVG